VTSLSQRAVEAADAERIRIARNLHDMARRALERSPADVEALLDQTASRAAGGRTRVARGDVPAARWSRVTQATA